MNTDDRNIVFSKAKLDEIRQDGQTVLSSSDGVSIPMILGFVPGTITLWHGGVQMAEAVLEKPAY